VKGQIECNLNKKKKKTVYTKHDISQLIPVYRKNWEL